MLEIRLLGQFDLRRNGETLSLPSRPAQSLLAYLVLNPGVSHRREQLAGSSRPMQTRPAPATLCATPSGASARRLGQTRARAATTWSSMKSRSLSTQLPATGSTSAVVVRPSCRPTRRRTPSSCAARVYAGDLLPGFYDDWIVLERERIETAFESKMRLWLERQAGRGLLG